MRTAREANGGVMEEEQPLNAQTLSPSYAPAMLVNMPP
jgi:hypothetical protein